MILASVASLPPNISRRYRILEEIGSGGMGVVYRAYDRLTNQIVALKQVTWTDDKAMPHGNDARLALAREFRMLASLKHPGIISVLDYGFSADPSTLGLPYYTMEYLPEAQWLTQALGGASPEECLDMLVQLLDALVYVHRRGILHRDLKPANILVVDGQIRIVDFGLSIMRGQIPDYEQEFDLAAGTLAYMAPEMVRGEDQPGAAGDIYAVGVIAYEVLAGQHPFPLDKTTALLRQIAEGRVNFGHINAPAPVRKIVQQLMHRDPNHRYPSAEAVLNDLHTLIPRNAPDISANAARDSFLQAARFVGREREFATLCGAVNRALEGKGAAWCVGGESGVGKSRLLEEVRAYAMVHGAHVLKGQAIREGEVYGAWRDVLHRLCIVGELLNSEAAAFKAVVPDIERLLERDVADLPAKNDVGVMQAYLSKAIDSLLRRLTQPRPGARLGQEAQTIVIIMEDCHWAGSESLNLLKHLAAAVTDHHLLIIASYRDDEPGTVADELHNFHLLTLNRLDNASIIELSESMLGEAGRQPQIITMLQRETEGNAFFMVEVVRALADASGGNLENITKKTLPKSIFAGGMMRIVQSRLDTVPDWARETLKYAAVAGRYIDFAVLSTIAPHIDLEAWLTTCAACAVLDVGDSGSTHGRWRFAHDKLRDALLVKLSEEERTAMHMRVAQTLEQVHIEHIERYATQLAYHWAQVGTRQREFHYSVIAAQQAIASSANAEAEGYFQRAINLLDDARIEGDRRAVELELQIGLGVSMMAIRGYATPDVTPVFKRARDLSHDIGINARLLPVLTLMSGYYIARADYTSAVDVGHRMVAIGRRLNHPTGTLRGILTIGEADGFRGNFKGAEKHLVNVVNRYDPNQRRANSALQDFGVTAYELLGVVRWIRGYPDEAMKLGQRALDIAHQINHPISIVFALHWTGIIHFMRGEYREALMLSVRTIEQAGMREFTLFHTLGRLYEAICQTSLNMNNLRALERLQQSLEAYRQTGAIFCLPYFMAKQAYALALMARSDKALKRLDEAISLANAHDEHWFTPELYRLRGEVILLHTGHLHGAEEAFLQALDLAWKQEARSWALRASTSLARLWRDQGRADAARQQLQTVYDTFTEGHTTHDLRQARNLLV